MNASENQKSPVRIVFNRNSARTDILTGRQLPDYRFAKRGSVRFYEGRLDRPVDAINYMFASMVNVKIDDLILIRKLLPPRYGHSFTGPGRRFRDSIR